jgi:hypothetical protein
MPIHFRSLIFVSICLALLPAARADVAAIDRNKLPQTISILAAYDNLLRIEHCVDRYSEEWPCELDRQKVTDSLFENFGTLQGALRLNPENRELRLLAMLASHYAYNVDIDMSFEGCKEDYQPLAGAADSDVRPRWFHADFEGQANEIEKGMNDFLAIENTIPASQLPARFWHDYTSCATMSVMPAHALRAIDRWQALQPAPDPQRDGFLAIARSRFLPYLPQSKYETGEIWFHENRNGAVYLTASVCGVRVQLRSDWRVERAAFDFGVCSLAASLSQPASSVTLTARRQRPSETLEDFEKAMLAKTAVNTAKTPAVFCPASACDQFDAASDEAGRRSYLFFARPQPQYPGLALEFPLQAQQAANPNASDATFYHPRGSLRRQSGTIFYMVVLESPAAAASQANRDFLDYLQHLAVD